MRHWHRMPGTRGAHLLPTVPPVPRRCVKLALVHDVAEAIVGDITPTCGVSDGEKFRLEAAAVQRIKATLGGATLAGACAAGVGPAWAAAGGRSTGRMACWWRGCAETAHCPWRALLTPAGDEVEALWHEYEQGQSPEARLVKDFDKVTSAAGCWGEGLAAARGRDRGQAWMLVAPPQASPPASNNQASAPLPRPGLPQRPPRRLR